MSDRQARTIAIIGAGCTGAMTLIHLLENMGNEPVRVLLIDPDVSLGRGLAYAARPYPYLVNAPASTMSVRSQDRHDFVRFLQEDQPSAQVEDFPTRERFGDYVEARTREAIRRAPAGCSVERVYQEAVRLERSADGGTWAITLGDATAQQADEVVLALGNPPPVPVHQLVKGPVCEGIGDPWTAPAQVSNAQSVLVIGTGLTMVDTVCSLLAESKERKIHALSRRGMMPLNQTDTKPAEFDDARLAAVLKESGSLRELVHEVVQAGRRTTLAGGDWRRVVISVRQHAGLIWGRLSHDDRRRFLRHVRPYWDIHRHRFPAPVWSTVQAMLASGQLTLHAGRLESIEEIEGRFQARWKARTSGVTTSVTVDRIFNCTGPDYDVQRSPSALMQHLLQQGLVNPDGLHLGINTSALGEVLNLEAEVVPHLYYVGPLRRAQCWESTAVAELRVHAETLARHLARPDTVRQ